MQRFVIVVTVLVFALCLILWAWLSGCRIELKPFTLEPPDEFRPGTAWTGQINAYCAWYYYYPTSPVSCNWQAFYFTYDPSTRLIQHTAMILPNQELTIGALVLAWGQPIGIQQSTILVSVYWPGRYAYVVGRTFAPDNWVDVVVWAKDTAPDRWHGFTRVK